MFSDKDSLLKLEPQPILIVIGQELYIYYPNGIGCSKLTLWFLISLAMAVLALRVVPGGWRGMLHEAHLA